MGGVIQAEREQHMQRPWGSTEPGVLEEQPGGPCVWSRVSEGERRRRGGQGGDGAGRAGPCGPGGGLGFMEPWEDVWVVISFMCKYIPWEWVGGVQSRGVEAKEESPGHPAWLEGRKMRNKHPPTHAGRCQQHPVKLKINRTQPLPPF